jgi:myo-inositol-1(or 4)-monophosphatase
LLRDFNELENLQVSVKTNKTFVTSADLRTDKLLRKDLSFARPSYSIVTEESGEIIGEDTTYKWVVDPLDGTFNYMHGFPHWAISIALKKNDEVIAAVTYDPVKNEMFWAEKGCGAYLNDRKIRVSNRNKLDDLLISLGNLPGSTKSLTQSVRKSGSMTLDMAYLAAGRVDVLYSTPNSNEWDIAAGMLLIKEAGGVLLDKNGRSTQFGKDLAIMTNIRLCSMAPKLIQM